MTQQLPEGFVDPYDVGAVAAVLADLLRTAGVEAVGDLLGRLPGVRLDPGRPRRTFQAAVPPSVWVGTEHNLVMTLPAVHRHVVSGIVLQRADVPAGELPGLLAGLVSRLSREHASRDETSVALTAARDSLGTL